MAHLARARLSFGSSTLLALAAVLPASAQDPSPIVAGITEIWCGGTPGPVTGFPGAGALPLVSADDDASAVSLYAAIGTTGAPGAGHALAIGHEGLLGDAANGLFDTLDFNLQALAWLDAAGTKRLAVLSGHSEYLKLGNMTTLANALVADGWTVQQVGGQVTPAGLAGYGVVLVGNAWGNVSVAERDALEAFVDGGGGLYLAGLGWSWSGGLENYPMNKIGKRVNLAWGPGYINDPTNQHNGSPLFGTFYPDCSLQLPDSALAFLDALAGAHPADLDLHLRGNPQERTDFMSAAAVAASASDMLALPWAGLDDFELFLRNLLLAHPQWFGMQGSYDRALDSALAVGRAALCGSLVAAFPLDTARIAEIEPALDILNPGVHPDYAQLLRDHRFLLLDNRRLSDVTRQSLKDIVFHNEHVPRDLVRMTVRDEWTLDPNEKSFPVPGVGVNVFGENSYSWMENQFPVDAPAVSVPVFCAAVAHEFAHVVDSNLSANQAGFTTTKATLLADAGLDDLEYLRSQVGGAFFQNAPQEFVASMANQWNINAVGALRLGLSRLAGGRQEPLKQGLFMLDTYAFDSSSAPLYTMDAAGRVTVDQATLTRDSQQRITAVEATSFNLQVRYGSSGNVTSAFELPPHTNYCTAGTSTLGCTASLSASGVPSATAPSGFTVSAAGVESAKDGLFFFAANGRQANAWGNGTSFQCVSPPVMRGGLLTGSGTPGQCDGTFAQDLNARWTAKPTQNPGAGALVQAQLWYRDPLNTSNQTTSLSNAVEFTLQP